MRVIVTGGGTGGHIYPALAIADKIKEREPDTDILYVGSAYGLEGDIVPETGYTFKALPVKGRVQFSNPIKRRLYDCYAIGTTGLSVAKALRIINGFKPDAVIGTGGYVSLPIMTAAEMCGIPAYIHEQNAFPGAANRFLEKKAKKIFMGFQDADRVFKDRDKLVYTGNPVRSVFYYGDRDEARRELGIPKDDFTVFAFGGSQGALTINRVAMEYLRRINGKKGCTLVFGTGKYYFDDIMKELNRESISLSDNIIMKPYIKKMEKVIAASDLVISRSGALSLAEITVSGRPSILIPSPIATDNHQYCNAMSVADMGGAIVIEDRDVQYDRVADLIEELSEDRQRLLQMEEGAKKAAPPDAAQMIYEYIRTDVKDE